MKLRTAKIFAFVFSFASLAAMVGLIVFLFLPTLRENRSLSREIGVAYGQLDAQYAYRKNLLTNYDKVAAAREAFRHLAQQFLLPGREIDFITSVEALAAKNGVEERVSLAKSEGGQSGAPEITTTFTLTLNGPYHNVMQMLVDLEKMPTLLLTSGMEIRPGSSGEGQSFLSITIRGALVGPPNGLL
ncbi:MAG: hypothetical protein QY323_02440 [Patescibacteria group bacterium]|nr:MAG: hypothetical protein QY323_02440 [Patescibacteria group bacterium]